jgi:phosphoribosylanthranilate isomerase
MSGRARTIVKVCGLTRLEDARVALDAGADWLGFVLATEGPRAIAPGRAGEIVAALEGVVAVAVMVGVSPDEALRAARQVGATRVQLHRVDAATWPRDFPLPAAFAVPMDAAGRPAAAVPEARDLLVLDAADPVRMGGTGRTFPWAAARDLARTRDVMLAGGLDGGNVGEAIAAVRPFGVDAASRLERAPGIKDPDAVRRFVAAARGADDARP